MFTRVAFAAIVTSILTLIGNSVGLISTEATTSSVHQRTTAQPTARIVVRPVTAHGEPAPGVELATDSQAGSVDCSSANPSPGAVSRNIEFCSPSVAYAVACWNSAVPKHVLCSRDPSSGRIYSIRRSGGFATTGLAASDKRAPLRLVLGDGTVCLIRDGGAWSNLKSRPRWYGTYSCDHGQAVWSPQNAPHSGINESDRTWMVHVAPISGNGQVRLRSVRQAYFVGTYR